VHSLIPALAQDRIHAEMDMKKAAGCWDSSISAAWIFIFAIGSLEVSLNTDPNA
jgi:hypothetical protein